MASGFGNQGEVTYMDISGDGRSWADVVPDQYFGPEHCLGKEITLQIQQIVTEKYDDATLPRAVLRFSNDPKWLRVSKDNKQVLKELFGDSPSACVGKWIVISAGPNNMRNIVVKILPRHVNPAASNGHQVANGAAGAGGQPPADQNLLAQLAANPALMQQLLAAQQGASGQAQTINPVANLQGQQTAPAGGGAIQQFQR